MGALERILAVPGNGRVPERLRNVLGSGQAIAFVGAGASAPLYPLWGTLIRLLANGSRFTDVPPYDGSRATPHPQTTESSKRSTTCSARLWAS